MTATRVTMTMRPPGRVQRVWYRRLGLTPPLMTGTNGPWHAHWIRLLPYRWRRLHRAYANRAPYFWIPCPLCDQPYGGHEWGADIPDPTRAPNGYMGICSRCTRTRP